MNDGREIKINVVALSIGLLAIGAIVGGIIIGVSMGSDDESSTNNTIANENINDISSDITNKITNSINSSKTNSTASTNNTISKTNEINNNNTSKRDALEEFKDEISKVKNEEEISSFKLIDSTSKPYRYTLQLVGTDKNKLSRKNEEENVQCNYIIKTADELKGYGRDVLAKISSDKTKLYISPIFKDEKSNEEINAKPFEVYEVGGIEGEIKQVVPIYGGKSVDSVQVYILMEDGALKRINWINGLKQGRFDAFDIQTDVNIANIYGAMETFKDLTETQGNLGEDWNHVFIIEGEENKYYKVNVVDEL